MRRLFNAISLFVTMTIIVALGSAAVSAKGPTATPTNKVPQVGRSTTRTPPIVARRPVSTAELRQHNAVTSAVPVVPTRTGTAVMNWSGGSGLAQGTIHVSPDQRLANPKFVPQVAKQPVTHPVIRPNHAGAKPADVYLHNPRGGNVADNRVNRTPPIVRRQPVSTAGLSQAGIHETPNQRLANPKFVPETSNAGRSGNAKPAAIERGLVPPESPKTKKK